MNRLILVGNGFDIAHGLKTRYSDFIQNYLSKALNEFYLNNHYSDPLLSISFKNIGMIFTTTMEPSNPENVMSRLDILKSRPGFDYKIKSNLLSNTIENLIKYNWVDIENQYFIELIKCKILNRNTSTYRFDENKIKDINNEFDFLKQNFIIYLKTICDKTEINPFYDYIKLFTEQIKDNDLQNSVGKDLLAENIKIVSFNYTETAILYKEECEKINRATTINYIHGKLDDNNNPIIFGFGDEYDKNYLDFEDFKNNDLFTHVKSFGYLKTSNYHNLMKFLDHNNYQVYIFGHSLGLSDRTMLKQIFEHQKCQSIKIFYHSYGGGKDDYTEKTFEAARHFADKGIMRLKIVSHDRSEKMPQFK